MKEIKAYIRSGIADKVLDALSEAGLPHATLVHVCALGTGTDTATARANLEYGRKVSEMVKLEIICPDKEEPRVVETIRKSAYTGKTGDGIIVVQNVNRLIKILTAKESLDAL